MVKPQLEIGAIGGTWCVTVGFSCAELDGGGILTLLMGYRLTYARRIAFSYAVAVAIPIVWG